MLAENHTTTRAVAHICNNLLDICKAENILSPNFKFKVYVIDSPVVNAFVLPNGTIFVYTGILPVAETEASLACILGHEISHALAHHSGVYDIIKCHH